MDRVCINKTTGQLIEMQSGGYDESDAALTAQRLDTLKQNAINAGYKESDIEVKWVSAEEYAALMAASYVPPRITILTMRQARLQMLAMGVLSQVEAAVAQAGDAAQIEWEYAMTVERDYPLFLSIKALLGFTDEQEETFFSEGSLL